MKKFILKSLFFVFLFFSSFFILVFLPKPQGSLHRVGHYIDYTPNYRNHLFKKINQVTRNFKYFSEVNIQKENSFSVLTLGDSFSKQAEYGYQNYLESDSISVLHYNKNINAIATLNNLINGDLFEEIDVDFVILETVARWATKRASRIDISKTLNYNEIIDLEDDINFKERENEIDRNLKKNLFRRQVVYFPMVNLFRGLDDNSFIGETYRVNTDDYYFSVDKKELLFYKESMVNQKLFKDLKMIDNLNYQLNRLDSKLKEKGVILIVMIVPTKYDIYYNHILNKDKYPKPTFFDNFKSQPKRYKYIETFNLLQEEILKKKDVFYYDDDHWTPSTAKLIAKELRKIISEYDK
jgi:hypothetical protein